MKAFFDTSVLISAFWRQHPGHDAAIAAFQSGPQASTFCGLHSLGEFYSTMTGFPARDRFKPAQVALLIEEIRKRSTLVALTEQDYAIVIDRAAERGFTSGIVYDALLLRSAEKVDADVIYTWNLKHYRSIAPALADRIRTP